MRVYKETHVSVVNSDKGSKTFIGKIIAFLTKVLGQLDIHIQKNETWLLTQWIQNWSKRDQSLKYKNKNYLAFRKSIKLKF